MIRDLTGTKRPETICAKPELEKPISTLIVFKSMNHLELCVKLFDNIFHNVCIPWQILMEKVSTQKIEVPSKRSDNLFLVFQLEKVLYPFEPDKHLLSIIVT